MLPRTALHRLRARPDGEDGFALLTTLLVMAVLAAFSLVALQQTIGNTAAARKDQDWVAALSAAQAGIDDYVARLNDSNGGYYVHTTASPDAANPAMGYVSAGVPKWAPVPPAASGQASRGSFHYDIDTSGYTGTATSQPNGNIVVESTGKVGARTRTLKASVRRSGFVDFVYFTDFETQDPVEYPTTATAPALNRTQAATLCTSYWGTRDANCTNISFNGDTMSGPVHSNDTMLICSNVVFQDAVTTMSAPVAANGGKPYRTDSCGATSGTTFARPDSPRTVKKVSLPSTNLGLKAETTAAASPRGCLYVGPTKIVIKGSQIRVTSPWTKTITPGCPKGSYFTIPANGVVYVDVVPAEGTADPNSWGAAEAGKPACPASGNPIGYPIASETGWSYPCKAGDVFIEQENGSVANALSSRLTVSANNNLYITNHLDYAGGTSGGAFLGLIAEQFVYVWHPVSGTSNLALPGQGTPFTDARISAALLSVNHAIAVQNNSFGAGLGTLNITGALTQKYRGIVRRGTAGYGKNYVYDERLAYDSPPRFLNPTISSFSAVRTREQRPRFR